MQKIWRFRLKSGKIKYWWIFNLAFVAWIDGYYVHTTLSLAVLNLVIWCSIDKLPNLMYRQYFCIYVKLYF